MRQALELALEALEHFRDTGTRPSDLAMSEDAITAIKQALAQPEQEPVGCIPWHWVDKAKQIADGTIAYPDVERAQQAIALIKILLKSTPPQRKPLTDEQILHFVDIHVGAPSMAYPLDNSDWITFARAIEAAHGIKE